MGMDKLLNILSSKSTTGYMRPNVVMKHITERLAQEGIEVKGIDSNPHLMLWFRAENKDTKFFITMSYDSIKKQWNWGEVRTEIKGGN